MTKENQGKNFNGVRKIDGSLSIVDSEIHNLGDLKEVTRNMSIKGTNIISLGKLEKVGGNLNLQNTNIKDLGQLKRVGGKLNLRGTKISNLKNLQYVGGHLYLSKKLEGRIDLSKIVIKGKISFWKDVVNDEVVISSDVLSQFIPCIPNWDVSYVSQFDHIIEASQKLFFNKFKSYFLDGIYLNVNQNMNYAFALYFDFINEYDRNGDLKRLEFSFKNLAKYYPKTRNYTIFTLMQIYLKAGNVEQYNKLSTDFHDISLETILKFQDKLQTFLFNGKIIHQLGGNRKLTKVGKENIGRLISFADEYLQIYEKEKKAKFCEIFFNISKPNEDFDSVARDKLDYPIWSDDSKFVINEIYNPDYYKKFFTSSAEFEDYKKIDKKERDIYKKGKIPFNRVRFKNKIPEVVKNAIICQCQLIMRKAENMYRISIGMPQIRERLS